ncbi:MAG: hypothetical protein ACKVRN_02710 [Pyrinomonadaceae bacterium]
MSYDAFGNLTERSSAVYGFGDSFSTSYTNNRSNGIGDDHDAAGNVVRNVSQGYGSVQGGPRTYTDTKTWRFDAAGRMVYWDNHGPYGDVTTKREEYVFDGDGRRAIRVDMEGASHYSLVSSVTGKKVTDIVVEDRNGQMVGIREGGQVHLGNTVIHDTTFHGYEPVENTLREFGFTLTDPVSGSTQQLNQSGSTPDPYPNSTPDMSSHSRVELAGLGTVVPNGTPEVFPLPDYGAGGFGGNARTGCVDVDGSPIPCNVLALLQRRWAKPKKGNSESELPAHEPAALWSASLDWKTSFSRGGDEQSGGDEPCTITNPDGTILTGYKDENGICQVLGPGNTQGPTVDINENFDYDLSLDFRCNEAANGYAAWVDCSQRLNFTPTNQRTIADVQMIQNAGRSNPCGETTDINGSLGYVTGGLKIGDRALVPYVGINVGVPKLGGSMILSDGPPGDDLELSGQIGPIPFLGYQRTVKLDPGRGMMQSLKDFLPNSQVATNSFGAMSPQVGVSVTAPLYRFSSGRDSVLCR